MSNRITENRALISALQNAAIKFDVTLTFFSDDWLVKISKGDQDRFIFGYTFDINSQASATIASDKVACYQLLSDANLAVVPHYLLSTVLDTRIDRTYLETLFGTHSDFVLKPTKGSRGELVTKVTTPDALLEYVDNNSQITSWAASPFIEIKKELRLVILNNKVQLAYEKINPPSINGLKMFNINLGASASSVEIETISQEVIMLARDAMKCIGLAFGAVDIIFDDGNNPSVLEINSGFSLEHFALGSESNRAKVIDFYELVIGEMFA